MKPILISELFQELNSQINLNLAEGKALQHEQEEILLQQPREGKWSVIQIIAHLNSYGRYYLPEINKAITRAENTKALNVDHFYPGWLGNYFTKMMLPGHNGQVTNKMQSPKDHRPSARLDVQMVLQEFMEQQYELLMYIEKARKIDIGKIRVPISLTRLIKLKLGDTFRFLVAHQVRHFLQVNNTINSIFYINDKFPGVHQAM